METLNEKELKQVNGGGFAHDVGTVLRFTWIDITEGYASAVADYAINKVICEC